MSCPNCGKENGQNWHRGYPQTLETPAEPSGWECGHCGNEYGEDTGARDDYEYEQERAYENEL